MFLSKIKELKNIYSIDSKDDFIIDLQLDRYRDVYSDWDYSPFQNRDLDEDFVKYLLDCSYEIGLRYKMKVLFHLPKTIKDKNKEEKSTKGIRHFFAYQYRRNKNYMLRVIRDTIIFFLIGTLMITISTLLKSSLNINLFNQVLVEGLYIGGWVMMWEMFSTWFFHVNKYRNKIKHFKRLENIEYEYFYSDVEI